MERPTWGELRRQLRDAVKASSLSPETIAEQIGISRPALLNLLDGTSKNPRDGTQQAVWRWLNGEKRGRDWTEFHNAPQAPEQASKESYKSKITPPEQELLEFFLEHHPEMATFMSTTTEGLNAEDRRLVAVAIFNGFKKLAIQAGEQLPDWFFDLEKKFVAR